METEGLSPEHYNYSACLPVCPKKEKSKKVKSKK